MAIFPSPLSRSAYFSFYTGLYPLSNVHVWVRLSRTDTCPISPYPEWLGVVVKAEVYGSVKCRVLNGSRGSFPFVFGRYTIQCPFPYEPRYFRYFPKLFLYCSYPFFQGDLGYAEDRIILNYISRLLGLLLHVLGYTPPRLGPGAPM